MDFDTLPEDTLSQNEALITSYLKEQGVDSSPGTAIGETTVKPGAMLFTGAEVSFQETLDNLDLDTADDEYATLLLKNYGLEPQTAGPGTGYVMLLTKSEEDLVVRKTTVFSAGSYSILLSRDYIGTVNYSSLSSGVYTPLRKYDDEYYYMLVEGTTSRDMTNPLLPGTALTTSKSITGLESAEVATAFSTVRQARSLDDLKEEVANGVSAKILAGPAHIKAMLEESDEISVIDVSVVGMNDSEMLRDSANIYGTSSGGYVDIYTKTENYSNTKEVSKVGVPLGNDRYRVMIDKDDAPGFYYIKSVSYNNVSRTVDIGLFDYTFGVDLTDELFVPNFPEAKDARYSPFQNCSVEFEYSGVGAEDTAPVFIFEIVYMPNVNQVQDFIADPEVRTPAADYVTKACVPLFLSIELNISYSASSDRPDETLIAEAVANVVNKVPMGQQFLSGAEIACAVTSLYPDTVVKLPVVMESFMIDNDGVFIRERSIDTLNIPNLPERGITFRTATFMTNPADISVSLTGDKK